MACYYLQTLKALQEKLAKGKPGVSGDDITDLQIKHTTELAEFDKKASTEKYEKKRAIVESAHKIQMKTLTDKVHKRCVHVAYVKENFSLSS